MTKMTKWHFSQKAMTKTKSKFAVKINTAYFKYFIDIKMNYFSVNSRNTIKSLFTGETQMKH